ncbi:MAG: ABC transporter substrate-binding protein [Chloroflexi bacterium]|nr:ABC transporter substrate-binding protein [Chloroflexota bacterium]
MVPHWDPRLLASVANGVGFCYGGLLRFAIDRINVESRITPVPLPDAAESWKQLDDLTWEFKLNPNVYWHDRPPVNGRKVTAEDIKYGIEQLRDNSIHRGVFKIISEITIKDPSTITIKTSEPYAHMLKILAGALYVFTAPEMVKEPGGAKTWCVGYGPWKLVKWDPQGGYEMERHPRYHLKGHTGLQLPYMDRIEHFTFSDGATQIAAFVTRKVHNIVAFGADQTIAILDRCTPNGTCQGDIGTQTPAASARILMRLDKAPFNDVRVRRALSMGMDRQAILDTIYQGVGYPSQQVPFDAMGLKLPLLLDQRGPYHQFNPTEAKRLLAEAGYPDGFETTMVIGTSPGPGITIPETIQFQWKENLKVRVQFEPKESLAFSKTLFDKTYGAMIYAGSTINALDWDSHTYGMMHSKSGSNWAYVNDPEVDRLVEAQRTTFDPVKQRDIYWKIFDLDEKNIYRIDSVARYNLHLYDISLVNATGSNYTWFSDYAQRSLEAVWFKD